ncbi:hypothetical protein F4604DRAFT_1786393 [Suillus subluteus]|nr:hypothetical protein F4604DRAFT_1786393 [Suillus subluteus]
MENVIGKHNRRDATRYIVYCKSSRRLIMSKYSKHNRWKPSKKRSVSQVKYDKWVVQRNRETDAKRKKRREASSAKLAAVVPRVTPDEITKMRVIEVDLQIRWHRQFDAEVPAAKHLKGKSGSEKKAISTAAAARYICGAGPKIQDENVPREDAECAMVDSDDEEGLW